ISASQTARNDQRLKMEEDKFNARDSQLTLTPSAAAQPTAQDVVMEEANSEKDNKVITDSAVAVNELLDELSGLVDDYIKIFKPIDSAEWNQVLTEIDAFLEAEKKLTPLSPEGHFLPIARRLQIERSPRLEKDGTPRLKLQEAILIIIVLNVSGCLIINVKHVIYYYLEREPAPPKGAPPKTPGVENSVGNERVLSKDDTSTDEQSNINTPADKSASRRMNPHKYLLHKPTFSQLMVYISTAFKEINENSALLLYLSADGTKHASVNGEHNLSNGYMGGVATNSRKPADKADGSDSGLINCLHPNDLVPFTRKPLCIIVDSNNSTAFANFPKVFNQPFLCLMSPVEYPSSIPGTMSIKIYYRIDKIEKSLKRFLQDDFLRQFLVRFVLCSALLKAHNSFQNEKHFPSSCPPLPYTLFDSPNLLAKLSQITKEAQVESLYSFPTLVVEVNEGDLSPDDNNI
ncbi:16175_t:CDS:2, partial [Racocetra fulgida]